MKHNNRDIFFDEVWFESHRSIITKIEYQFRHSKKEESYKWFKHLFLCHPFFDKSNIITKQSVILRNVKKVRKFVDPTGSTSNNQMEVKYINNYDDIKKCIGRIRRRLFEKQDYSKILAGHLTAALSVNSPLTEVVKADIRFLVTAFITELYAYGYSMKYIERVPDIIIFRDNMNEFPFEKALEDFGDDKEKYDAYITQEKSNPTMDKCFSGLVNLINRPFKDGYYMFKVENVVLDNPQPITIGDVTFYNPQKNSMLDLSIAKDEWKERYLEAEVFCSTKTGEAVGKTKHSTCNVIVKSKIRSHNNIESPSELFQAFHIASKNLEVLLDIVEKNGVRSDGTPFIYFHRHIKLHGSRRVANFSFSIFNEGKIIVDITDSEKREAVLEDIAFINRINRDSKIGSKLIHIVSTHSKLKNNEHFFNFKDIWIAWESLMPRPKMKEFAKEIYYVMYKKHYLLKIFLFLNINLSNHNMFLSPAFWTLDNEELKTIGLHYEAGEKQHKRKFLNRYNRVTTAVPIEIVKDVISRVDEYIKNESLFYQKLNKWIEHTIDEVYIERNMEVHKNLQNDLSAMKLKEDFLRISGALFHELVDYTDKRNPGSLELILDRIQTHKNRL